MIVQSEGKRLRGLWTSAWVCLGICQACTTMAMAQASDLSLSEEPEIPADAYVEPELTESDRDHWSLKPLSRTSVAATTAKLQRVNEIDDYVAHVLEQRGLNLQPAAAPEVLLRRVFLDMTGLPPTAADRAGFLEDKEPDAYVRLVDRLLASPACGEHWAQSWLDLARFAETDGFEHDTIRPDAWRYRDWVVRALNENLPYDQFIRQQIAGDLIAPDDPASAVATQFCLSGADMPDINSQDERQHTVLNELTSTVCEVILGLQAGCAQCHDHKYDPISQADFYRLRAIFEPAVQLKKNVSLTQLRQENDSTIVSHLMIRGDYRRPGPTVEPGVLRVLESDQLTFVRPALSPVTNARLRFADWLVSPHHPLTARVLVNRVWQQHFGVGLSETSSDFGVMGQEPVNLPLLDWLASWVIEHQWNLKALHRLIVTSAVYRQRSYLNDEASADKVAQWEAAIKGDPKARYLSRFPRQRLRGEVIRDAMLQAAGVLNRKAGGPGIRPPLPEELRSTLLKDQWLVTEDKNEHQRRSLYVFARRNLRFPMFEVFDRPAANESCARRNISITAPQSLHLLNSEFSASMARLVADNVLQQQATPDKQVEFAFELILNRKPSRSEDDQVQQFLRSVQDTDAGMMHLCLALFNCNEFIFVD